MANSGIEWIDLTFDFCVRLLYQAAAILGMSYEEINVWLFVFILPGLLSRHEAISRLLEVGLTIPEAASVSGHKTASMLMRYAHPDPAKVRQKMMQ